MCYGTEGSWHTVAVTEPMEVQHNLQGHHFKEDRLCTEHGLGDDQEVDSDILNEEGLDSFLK